LGILIAPSADARYATGHFRTSAGAAATSGPECFSKFTKFNVRQKAREVQPEFAAALPMNLNANITMSTAVVLGPRIILTAVWNIEKAALDARLQANTMTLVELSAKMDATTKNSVCSLDVMAAFVGLGGQVQYLYKTVDGFVVLSPVVTAC
jgi:hypothetical protein